MSNMPIRDVGMGQDITVHLVVWPDKNGACQKCRKNLNTTDCSISEKMAFPLDLHSCLCTREEIHSFAEECKAMGVQYIGLCCGNSSNLLRIVSEVYEKNAPAQKYAPEMAKHFIFGDKKKFSNYHTENVKTLLTKHQEAQWQLCLSGFDKIITL